MDQDEILLNYFELKSQMQTQLAQCRKWWAMPDLLDKMESVRNAHAREAGKHLPCMQMTGSMQSRGRAIHTNRPPPPAHR